jgi:hypothetical protein
MDKLPTSLTYLSLCTFGNLGPLPNLPALKTLHLPSEYHFPLNLPNVEIFYHQMYYD